MKAQKIAELLKDTAYDINARRLTASIPTGPDTWRHIAVSHAALLSNAPDGWDVEITEHGL